MTQISVSELFRATQRKMRLTWVAGLDGGDKMLNSEEVSKPSLALIGHLNFVHPNRVQVLGCSEMDYLRALDTKGLKQAVSNLFSTDLTAVIVTNDEPPPKTLLAFANKTKTPLFISPEQSPRLMDMLRHFLVQAMAESISFHGVFIEVQGFGVLIKGEAAIGKSELALELITRGHRLIADDVVDFYKVSPEKLEGRCPPLLQDFIEVRGLGVLNVRALFGDNSVKPTKPLDLIVQLAMAEEAKALMVDRISVKSQSEKILGIKVPKVTLPVAAGRNIAVLIEAAVRNHILLLRGINSSRQFIRRQYREIRRNKMKDG